jgi:hypothetical protein
MTYRRSVIVAMTACVLLFAETPLGQARGPGFAGVAPAQHPGVQGGPFAGGHQASLPPSNHAPARWAFPQLYPITQSRYDRSFLPRLGAAPTRSSRTKPEDTFQFPPAAAPAAEAISSSPSMIASYAASYCVTPQGACNLAERQMVGDKCWCLARAGKYVNGTVE